MKIKIQGHNTRLTESLEEYATSKVSRLERYLPNITSVDVDISRQRTARGADIVIAQITVRHSRGAILRAEEKMPLGDNDSPLAALNGAIDKMYRRIRRFKGKARNRRDRVRERFIATPEELEIAEALPETEPIMEPTITEASEYEDYEPEIVRRKQVAITAMNEDEAIEQMELLGHGFFVFFNMDTNGINVLYRRESGGYGVLVPDMQ